MIRVFRLLLAALSGYLIFASYAPLGWWIAGIIGVGVFYVSVMPWSGRFEGEEAWARSRGKNAKSSKAKKRASTSKTPRTAHLDAPQVSLKFGALLGFIHGFVLYLFMLPWIGSFVGTFPYVALAVTEALYSILIGIGAVAMARWKFWGPLGFALLYVAVELFRGTWPFGGFSWTRLAWGQIDGPLRFLAPFGGPALITFVMVLLASGVIASRRRGWIFALASILLIALCGLIPQASDKESTGTVKVAAIQGNVPRMGLEFNAQRRAVLNNHVRVTETVKKPVDIVIWPENASDVNPFKDEQAREAIASAVKSTNAPILVGTLTSRDEKSFNTAVVFNPDGTTGDTHEKKYLQPFGEYMPYRDLLRKVSSMVDYANNLSPGTGNGVVRMPALGREVKVGIATCYEVIVDRAYRDAVQGGAEILSTPTNNATFGFSDMTYQQLAMSRLRAVETDRAVVVAATSGVSALVLPDGRVIEKTHIFEPAALVDDLPLRDTVTPAVRWGAALEYVLAALGAFAFILALWSTREGSTKTRPAKTRPSRGPKAQGQTSRNGSKGRASARPTRKTA